MKMPKSKVVDKSIRNAALNLGVLNTKREKKISVRIPESYVDIVKLLITYLDGYTMINKDYPQVSSEKAFLRSLRVRVQEIIIKVLISK
ncbi:hypothetical protein [Shewanella ulleungensis]|uniref:hypothetical protein n=1 Tax=Shewanella ulleungensis TaxID=2282699 RepID=UPI003D79C388